MDTRSRFARADKFLETYEAERPKLLSTESREYMKKLVDDPALGRAFLIRAGIMGIMGIMGIDGKLAPPYNGE